ncbi:MAG: PilW family protein [Gammaproteobacteria bacterium]
MSRLAHDPRQRGLSLIELLVALALSLFLIAGVVVMFFSSTQSYRVEQQVAALQQRERLAATFVGSVVQSAGYYAQPLTYDRDSAFPANTTFVNSGQSIYGTAASYAGGSNDTITLRILPGPQDQVLNCLGDRNTGADAQLYVNKFFLDTANKELECTLSGTGITTQTQPLLDGVTSLQFLYGVDTSGDGSADSYLDASAVTNWSAVRSVKMVLGFATLNAATAQAKTVGQPILFQATFPIRIASQ